MLLVREPSVTLESQPLNYHPGFTFCSHSVDASQHSYMWGARKKWESKKDRENPGGLQEVDGCRGSALACLLVRVQSYRQHIWAVTMAILKYALCRKLHKQRKYSSPGLSHFLPQECPKQIPQRIESFSFVPKEMQIRLRRMFQVKVKSTELLWVQCSLFMGWEQSRVGTQNSWPFRESLCELYFLRIIV